MAIEATLWRPDNRKLFWCICVSQVLLIALPFMVHDMMPVFFVVSVISLFALLGSITTAVHYLCFVSAVIPTWLYHEHLTLPLDFRFYEGLLVVVMVLAGLLWLSEGQLKWHRRTALDRPMLLLLGMIVFSCLVGFFYGQSTSQMLRDVRYPLYYVLFFAVTWFFDVRKALTFLYMLIGASAIIGVEYIIEFLTETNLSVSGGFYRVSRLEGVLLPVGIMAIGSVLFYDQHFHRRLISSVALLPIGLASILTVGRGMWIAIIMGVFVLGLLTVLDRRRADARAIRLMRVLGIPAVILGTAYFFQQQTGSGISDAAVRRVTRAATRYEEDHSVAGRLASYQTAVNEIRKRPIFGGGHGAVVYIASFTDPHVYDFFGAVDNLYLTIGLRMGLVGIGLFVWVFVFGIWRAYRLFQNTVDSGIRLFCAAFITIYCTMLVYGLVDTTMFGNRLIFIHATFLALIARFDQDEKLNNQT